MDNLLFYVLDSNELMTHQLKRLQPKLHFGLQTVQLSFEIIVRLTDI